MSFKLIRHLIILLLIISFSEMVISNPAPNLRPYAKYAEEADNHYQKSFQSKIDSLEYRNNVLEEEKSILLIEMGNRKHKIEKLRSDSANHIVQLNLENSRSESLADSLKYLFVIVLFFALFVLIQFGIIFYAIKRITINNSSQTVSSNSVIANVHSNPQLESLEMLRNKGFISEQEYFRQRQSLMVRQA